MDYRNLTQSNEESVCSSLISRKLSCLCPSDPQVVSPLVFVSLFVRVCSVAKANSYAFLFTIGFMTQSSIQRSTSAPCPPPDNSAALIDGTIRPRHAVLAVPDATAQGLHNPASTIIPIVGHVCVGYIHAYSFKKIGAIHIFPLASTTHSGNDEGSRLFQASNSRGVDPGRRVGRG